MAARLIQIGADMVKGDSFKKHFARMVPALGIILLGCAGGGSYPVIYHRTFTQARALGAAYPIGIGRVGETITVTGIYNLKYIRPDSLPVLQLCDSLRQPITMYLSGHLACEPGSLVRVTGHSGVDDSVLSCQDLFYPTTFQRIATTRTIRDHASAEYHKIKPELEQVILPPESRLKLPVPPDWQMFWLDHTGSVILRLVCADLMYAATVEFVYHFASQALKAVYAHAYFKGE